MKKRAARMRKADRVLIRQFVDEYSLAFRFGWISSDVLVEDVSEAFSLLYKKGLSAALEYMDKMLQIRFPNHPAAIRHWLEAYGEEVKARGGLPPSDWEPAEWKADPALRARVEKACAEALAGQTLTRLPSQPGSIRPVPAPCLPTSKPAGNALTVQGFEFPAPRAAGS
jgi:hypothetical protein